MNLKVPVQSEATDADEAPLVTSDHEVPVVYADGIGDVEILGDNVRVTYFEIRTIAGVRMRNPILEIVRPLRSCGTLSQMMAQKLGTTGQRHNH